MEPANELPQVKAARPWLAAALAVGIAITGNGKLLAQDVPPPPPDAQSTQQQDQQQMPAQQQAPDPMSQQQYGGDPSQQQGQQAQPQQQGQPVPQGQPLEAQQIEQLVAPIALYPDALVAQILAAATYPTQVVEADQWRQQQGNASPDQIAAAANAQQWDPSVKALTAFPSVLSQMDHNMQWTADLGNAYYNQPQDVMDAVQRMRQRAQAAGSLQDTQQQTISEGDGGIEIAPANPDVVYVPVYNPWVVYGSPVMAFPGYYYGTPPGVFFGVGFGYRIGFGIGIPLRPWAPWGWGWHNWGCGWHNRTIVYNRTTYITRSTTVINRGFNRPGGPPVQLSGTRGSFMNRPGYAGYANRVASGARPGPGASGFVNRPGSNNPGSNNNPGNFNRPTPQPGNANGGFNRVPPSYNRPAPANGVVGQPNRPTPSSPGFPSSGARPTYTPGPAYNRPNSGATPYRPSAPPAQNYSRPAPTYRAPQQNYSRPSAPASRPAPAPHAAPAPHGNGGGGGEHRH
jgi:hypothetical protein